MHSMANLLAKFRIDYTDLIMIREITRRPQDTSKAFFKHMIQDFRHRGPVTEGMDTGKYIMLNQTI
jgi:solute carrier family 12 sodium/potassium/chloride transporter 2